MADVLLFIDDYYYYSGKAVNYCGGQPKKLLLTGKTMENINYSNEKKKTEVTNIF